MCNDLNNKIVVITGGAMGIGYEIADRFLKKCAKIAIILDFNEEQGVEAVKSLNSKYGSEKAVFHKCDVTEDIDVVTKNIYDIYNYVDVLVNSAGIVNELIPKKTIDVNVTASIQLSFKFMERMRKDRGGSGGTIINLSSIYGFRVAPFLPVYQASKFAVLGFTKSLGHQDNFSRTGVRVVAICPGFTETNLTSAFVSWDDEGLAHYASTIFEDEIWQKVGSVGEAAVEIFEKADSGTAWLSEGGKPVVIIV